MTRDEAMDFYISQIDMPHGKKFARAVGQYQEKYLREGEENEEAFRRAVEMTAKLFACA